MTFYQRNMRMESTDILQRFKESEIAFGKITSFCGSSVANPWCKSSGPSDLRVAIRWLNAKTHRKPLTVSRIRKDSGFQSDCIASLKEFKWLWINTYTYTYHF